MATEVKNYQCPSCTGPLQFSSESGKLGCEYCGESFDVETIELLYAGKEQVASNAASETEWDFNNEEWREEEAAHMKAYNCPSCGAQLICDDTTAATSCPYCSNPTILPGQFTGILRPDFVIPFKKDKEAAKAALKNYYKGKKFLPKSFLAENKLEEIKGIYVPFWLFDGRIDADIHYGATKNRNYTQGNEKITVTEHYHIVRQGEIAFERVPVDGSTKMPDEHMDSIEPYDYLELVPFSSAYLPGYMANKYDVALSICSERANERIRKTTEDTFNSTVTGYATLKTESSNININAGEVKYVLLPVWILNTKWKGKDFLFAMNGQSGKLIGDLPIDKSKFLAWFLGISLPLMILLGIILF